MTDTADDGPSMVMAGSGCVICRTEDDDTHRYFLGRLDNGPSTVLRSAPSTWTARVSNAWPGPT